MKAIHFLERISFYLDCIQDFALGDSIIATTSAEDREQLRVEEAVPIQPFLGCCTTSLLELLFFSLRLFLNGCVWPMSVSNGCYLNENWMC